MNTDSIALLIAGSAGALVGILLTTIVIGGIAQTKAARVAKETWAAAHRFYRNKVEL